MEDGTPYADSLAAHLWVDFQIFNELFADAAADGTAAFGKCNLFPMIVEAGAGREVKT